MPFKSLLETWGDKRAVELSKERYSIHLPVEDAARVEALSALFPGNSPESLITDLLNAALDEIEASMPYKPGETVIREDEFGDPIYEDVGLTPKFLELVKAHRAELDKP